MFREVLAYLCVCRFASWRPGGTRLWDGRGRLLSPLYPVLACGSLVTCVPGMNEIGAQDNSSDKSHKAQRGSLVETSGVFFKLRESRKAS